MLNCILNFETIELQTNKQISFKVPFNQVLINLKKKHEKKFVQVNRLSKHLAVINYYK